MAELILVRHGQASFGADDYDRLSETGRHQARMAGQWLREHGWKPDRTISGTLRRQRESADEMGFPADETDAGFDEYDSEDLLAGSAVPPAEDRKAYFRHLRERVHSWIDGSLDVREGWSDFTARIASAMERATKPGASRVLVVTSGGVIGRITAAALGAPERQMMALNLQIRNTAMTRFVFAGERLLLHSFNTTPHLDRLTADERTQLETYA